VQRAIRRLQEKQFIGSPSGQGPQRLQSFSRFSGSGGSLRCIHIAEFGGTTMNTTVTAIYAGKTLTTNVEPESVDALLKEADRVGLDQYLAQRWIIMAMECNDELTQKEHWILAISILRLACSSSNPTGELALRRARVGGSSILCDITRHAGDRYNFNFKLGLTLDQSERSSIH
jgi:hypothetical protein